MSKMLLNFIPPKYYTSFEKSYQMSSYPIKFSAYSGIRVYVMTIKGISVMRRLHDNYVNATQVLRAAGLAKPQRTKILEKDISKMKHEKVQGGYAGFQGTWIPEEEALSIAIEYGLEEPITELLNKPIDAELLEEIQSSPIPAKRTPGRSVAASSVSGSDDERPQKRRPGRPRTRNRPSPTDRTSSPSKTRSSRVGKVGRPRESSLNTPGTQANERLLIKKHCGVCGITLTPDWKQALHGTLLCNVCSIKWKVKKYFGGSHPSGRRSAFLITKDAHESDSADSAILDEANDPYYPWKSKVKSLNKVIKSTKEDSKQMTSLLIESKLEDRDIDQTYRSIIPAQGQIMNESSVISAFLAAVKKK